MMEWQDIATAPRDGTMFLGLCDKDCGTRNHWIVRFDADVDTFVCSSDAEELTDLRDGGCLVSCIRHWMPLPPPPTVKE